MKNEIMSVSFESLSGIPVNLTAETVRSTLTRGNGNVSDQEVAMFLRTCQAKKLDPFENGEVYLIKYDEKTPAQLVVGCHAYIRRADHYPDYRGFKAGITVIRGNHPEPIMKEGACVYKALGEQLIGGWCRVSRLRQNGYMDETFVEVDLGEYSTGKSNWSTRPATMIRKVAISQAFRAAFPNEYEGLYTIEEIEASGGVPDNLNVAGENGDVVIIEDKKITQEQRQELFNKARTVLGDNANNVVRKMLDDEGLSSTHEVRESVFEKMMQKLDSYEAHES